MMKILILKITQFPNYPDKRKSPIVHIAHRGETTYLRGGTDDDKQVFREENNLDF